MDHAFPGIDAPARLRLHCDTTDALPALRLVLQPSGMVLEVPRPEAIVGRHSDADVRLPLPDVSRRHCRLAWAEGGWQVTDLNSLNGVQVNGETVLHAPLEQGDLLRIGGFTFFVELSEPASAAGSSGHVRSIAETLAGTPIRRAS